MNKEFIEAKKKRLRYLQEETREAKKKAADLERKANQYEKEIYEEENRKEDPTPSS